MTWLLPLYVSALAFSVVGVFRCCRQGAIRLARASAVVGFGIGVIPLVWIGVLYVEAVNHGTPGTQSAAPWLILIALLVIFPALLVWATAVMIAFARGRAAASLRHSDNN